MCDQGEEQIFFEDHSGLILSDDPFARLLTFPNVIITGHRLSLRETIRNRTHAKRNNHVLGNDRAR